MIPEDHCTPGSPRKPALLQPREWAWWGSWALDASSWLAEKTTKAGHGIHVCSPWGFCRAVLSECFLGGGWIGEWMDGWTDGLWFLPTMAFLMLLILSEMEFNNMGSQLSTEALSSKVQSPIYCVTLSRWLPLSVPSSSTAQRSE